jgi:hypothetical protein
MPRALTDVEHRELPEVWRVLLWRQEELERAGYPVHVAMDLAENAAVDLHAAVELLKHGATVQEALRILT